MGTCDKSGSGIAVNGAQIKKWPGVSGTGSFTSDEMANNGREFRHAST